MRLYFCHSSSFDYKKELYDPLRLSLLNKTHEIFLPHEKSDETPNTRALIKTLDIVFAEVSFPSTGLGIELGWAADTYLPIVCLHKTGTKPSPALQQVSKFFIEYSSPADMIKKTEDFLSRISFE